MLNILISSFFSSIIILINGVIFIKLIFNRKINDVNIWESGLYGFISIGFISVFLNFFFSINKSLGAIFFISSLIIFCIYFYNLKKKKELILIILFVSFTSSVLITSASINTPDAGLYHLPYISILQENKLILGLTNLHFRFGHISIFQYISAIYSNFFFKVEFLNFPLASLFPFFFIFLIDKFNFSVKQNNASEIVLIFLIIIFSLYSFNRYGNYGNDVPASIYFFILIIFFLKVVRLNNISLDEFFNISIISIFLLTLKPSMAIVLLLPILIFLINKNKKKILKHRSFIVIIILSLIWCIKNILISGCIIFPLKETCFNQLFYFSENFTHLASNEAEAWAKGYPDSNKTMNYNQYSSNFNWVSTWIENHFFKILEKISPFLIILLFFFSKKIMNKSFYKSFKTKKILENKKIILVILFSFYCSALWFLKFPVYRFGISFIGTFLIFSFVGIFINNGDYLYKKKTYFQIISIGLVLFYAKNINRIINNFDLVYINSPWPKIYSLALDEKNNEKKFLKILDSNNNFKFYYSEGKLCMYSKSPCSNYNNKNLIKREINNYSVFYIKDN